MYLKVSWGWGCDNTRARADFFNLRWIWQNCGGDDDDDNDFYKIKIKLIYTPPIYSYCDDRTSSSSSSSPSSPGGEGVGYILTHLWRISVYLRCILEYLGVSWSILGCMCSGNSGGYTRPWNYKKVSLSIFEYLWVSWSILAFRKVVDVEWSSEPLCLYVISIEMDITRVARAAQRRRRAARVNTPSRHQDVAKSPPSPAYNASVCGRWWAGREGHQYADVGLRTWVPHEASWWSYTNISSNLPVWLNLRPT